MKLLNPALICSRIDCSGYGRSGLSELQFRKLLRNNHYAVVLFGSPEPILCAVFRVLGKRNFEIKRLAVSAQARRNGNCKKFLAQFKAAKLTVVLKETNEVAIEAAKKCGFRALELLRNYWDDCDGILFMR